MASFDVLADELRHTFGEDGPLPSSTDLRGMKRADLAAVKPASELSSHLYLLQNVYTKGSSSFQSQSQVVVR